MILGLRRQAHPTPLCIPRSFCQRDVYRTLQRQRVLAEHSAIEPPVAMRDPEERRRGSLFYIFQVLAVGHFITSDREGRHVNHVSAKFIVPAESFFRIHSET